MCLATSSSLRIIRPLTRDKCECSTIPSLFPLYLFPPFSPFTFGRDVLRDSLRHLLASCRMALSPGRLLTVRMSACESYVEMNGFDRCYG